MDISTCFFAFKKIYFTLCELTKTNAFLGNFMVFPEDIKPCIPHARKKLVSRGTGWGRNGWQVIPEKAINHAPHQN
jgi:hypothetical protein